MGKGVAYRQPLFIVLSEGGLRLILRNNRRNGYSFRPRRR